MARLTTAIEVARPPDEVFAYATDPTRFVVAANVTSGHKEAGTPPQPGARCFTTCRIGFVERVVTSESARRLETRRAVALGVTCPVAGDASLRG
jgi:hypothetical protein